MSERASNRPTAPGVLRHWGSHFKSPRQVAHWRGLFAPLLAHGWRTGLVLERRPENSAWTAELERDGVEIFCVPRPRGQFDRACVRAVRELCARFSADVFHCENIHTSPMLGAWLARVPVRIWQKHSMFRHHEESRPPTWKERLAPSTRLTCALATRVLAVSHSVAGELQASGFAQGKILVRNNPRTAGPESPAPDRAETRQQLGWSENEIVFVTIGQALPVKGWDVLFESFATVEKTFPSARLLFVGSHSGAEEKRLHEKLLARRAALGLVEKVHFTGHVADIAPALRAADVFVMPSRAEGFSHALIEALEHGRPCVATRTGIAPEVIEDGRNGILVERNDAPSLARALLALAGSSAQREEFARRAVVPASIPTLAGYAEQLCCDYTALLAGQSAPVEIRPAVAT